MCFNPNAAYNVSAFAAEALQTRRALELHGGPTKKFQPRPTCLRLKEVMDVYGRAQTMPQKDYKAFLVENKLDGKALIVIKPNDPAKRPIIYFTGCLFSNFCYLGASIEITDGKEYLSFTYDRDCEVDCINPDGSTVKLTCHTSEEAFKTVCALGLASDKDTEIQRKINAGVMDAMHAINTADDLRKVQGSTRCIPAEHFPNAAYAKVSESLMCTVQRARHSYLVACILALEALLGVELTNALIFEGMEFAGTWEKGLPVDDYVKTIKKDGVETQEKREGLWTKIQGVLSYDKIKEIIDALPGDNKLGECIEEALRLGPKTFPFFNVVPGSQSLIARFLNEDETADEKFNACREKLGIPAIAVV
jgi:hypothetical protein